MTSMTLTQKLTYGLSFKNSYAWKLQLIHLVGYLSIPYFITNAPWYLLLVPFIVGYINTTSIVLYFHRYLSHKLFEFKSQIFEYIFLFITTTALVSSSITWVSIHRKHHQFVDEEQDPHRCLNITDAIRVHFLSYWILPKLSNVRDLYHSKLHRFTVDHYFKIQLVYGGLLFLIDPLICIAFYLLPGLICYWTLNGVNTLSHSTGYRNFECADTSTNNLFIGYISGGEWHNNHHANPRSCNFGFKWWEFDPGYHIIKLIGKNIINEKADLSRV